MGKKNIVLQKPRYYFNFRGANKHFLVDFLPVEYFFFSSPAKKEGEKRCEYNTNRTRAIYS